MTSFVDSQCMVGSRYSLDFETVRMSYIIRIDIVYINVKLDVPVPISLIVEEVIYYAGLKWV